MDLKKIIILVTIISAAPVFAQSTHELFSAGNKSYQEGNIERAVQYYETILERGEESGALYYNLGNCYYRLTQYGLSRLNYERAKRFIYSDESLNENIAMLKLSLVDQIEAPPKFILNEIWDHFIALFSSKTIVWLTAGIYVVFLIVWAIYLHLNRRMKRNKFQAVFYLGIFFLFFSVIVTFYKINIDENQKFGVVLSSAVTVYAAPSELDTELFILHEGTKARILIAKQNWYEIQLIDGKKGWLKKNSMEKI
jgi:tetratricopeptide (TPR) repeat protein